jgi:hypothetical protein
VFPCARLVNMLRPASRQIPINHQKALWFSGQLFTFCLKVEIILLDIERILACSEFSHLCISKLNEESGRSLGSHSFLFGVKPSAFTS